MIPFLDVGAINSRFKDELESAMKEVLESGWYILGEKSRAFEKAFAEYCGIDRKSVV